MPVLTNTEMDEMLLVVSSAVAFVLADGEKQSAQRVLQLRRAVDDYLAKRPEVRADVMALAETHRTD